MDTLEVVVLLIQVLVPTGATVLLGMALVFLKHDQDRKLELARGEIQQLVGVHRDKVEAYKTLLNFVFEMRSHAIELEEDGVEKFTHPNLEDPNLGAFRTGFRQVWGWTYAFASVDMREVVDELLVELDGEESVEAWVTASNRAWEDMILLTERDLGIRPTDLTAP